MQRQDSALWEWSVFWRSDQVQSCMPVGGGGDADDLFPIWRDFFGSLPDGARILDLGTGNGSLAAQAVTVSRTRPIPFSVHGVDLADIEPATFVTSAASELREVVFHPRTPMEKLPFVDADFDAVASQYGLEYSHMPDSVAEALRVLRPAGRFRFLVHADAGVLKQRCRLQRRQAGVILDSDLFPRFLDAIRKIVDADRRNTDESLAAAENAIASLKRAMDALERKFADAEDRSLVDNLFNAVRQIPGLRRTCDRRTLVAMAANVEKLLQAQAKRLQAMETAAMDDVAVRDVAQQLELAGAQEATLAPATAGPQSNLVGYWLYGEKAAGADGRPT